MHKLQKVCAFFCIMLYNKRAGENDRQIYIINKLF